MRKTVLAILLFGAVAVSTLGLIQVRPERSPASPGDRDGTEFRMPADPSPTPRQQRPIRVDSIEVQRIAPRSALGEPGDLLITFIGQGFVLTSLAPRVVLTDDLVLDMTEVNRDGTELYVLLPRDLMSRVEAVRFDSVTVVNPGGRQDTEFARAHARATPARLLRPDPAAPAVRLVYQDGVFSREAVRP